MNTITVANLLEIMDEDCEDDVFLDNYSILVNSKAIIKIIINHSDETVNIITEANHAN